MTLPQLPARHRAAPSAWAVCAVLGALLAAGATALPATRVAAVLTLSCLTVGAALAGVLVHRPAAARPWRAVGLMLLLWTVGLTVAAVAGAGAPAAAVLIQGGALVAVGLVTGLFLRQRREPAPARGSETRWETAGRRVDELVVACIVALGLAQVVATSRTPDVHAGTWAAAISPLDVVLLCLLLRFAASRERLPVASLLALGGAVTTCVYDALATLDGARVAAPSSELSVLWSVAACLFIAAALHPTMVDVFTRATLSSRRSESARLVGLAPLALAPAGLYAVGGAGLGTRLPIPVYLVTGALITVLAVARGAQAVLGSERRAHQDELSGAANRRGLAVVFDGLLATAARPSAPHPGTAPELDGRVLARLCLLDIDDFKQVNDTFGHEAGDGLLRTIGERLRTVVGPAGTVARSGGDEFILLLTPDAPSPDQLLAAAFDPPFDVGTPQAPYQRRIRASAGWTAVHRDSRLAHALADADVALYAAKAAGKDTVRVFEPRLRADVLGRLALVEDLRRLLDGTGGGRLEVHYQPLVSLAEDRVLGCEALVRWQHPELGLLLPDTFLGLAEEHGLAARIDGRVLTESVAQLAAWDAAGLPEVFVSVNLGRSSMVDPALADRVRNALTSTGTAPSRLHLEITEHAELPPTAGTAALQLLAEHGVRVSLDDFGTGYTSLDYLRRYPISTLKLDRSITAPLQQEGTSALLSGVVQLAGSLGMEVLAEGIETQVQRERLTRLGVQSGQGWLLARPLTADAFAAHVRAQQPALAG